MNKNMTHKRKKRIGFVTAGAMAAILAGLYLAHPLNTATSTEPTEVDPVTLVERGLRVEAHTDSVIKAEAKEEADHEASLLTYTFDGDQIPEYAGTPFYVLNEDMPTFTEEELEEESGLSFSELDELGRCGVAEGMLSKSMMPTLPREDISMVHPTGFLNVNYADIMGEEYLYNRCHLLAFCLTGENANEQNLITGTFYFNTQGMYPFEKCIKNYINNTKNHVRYRVTPIYEGDNLVVSGVEMEARSIEDDGAGICFHVFIYNVEPGVTIDYATGESERSDLYEEYLGATTEYVGAVAGGGAGSYELLELYEEEPESYDYVLNINTGKIHKPDCASVADMAEGNKRYFVGNVLELCDAGYELCGICLDLFED